jgi:predicted nucleotidyltransferase
MVKKLVAEYKPEKIILFGSYANGNPTEDSDIDLFILKDTEEKFLKRWTKVHSILSTLHPGVALDTVILNPKELEKRLFVGDHFIQDIINNGEVLYAAN